MKTKCCSSTRVLVSMSSFGSRATLRAASTLTLWATCGRLSSFSPTRSAHEGHWEGTVCLESSRSESRRAEDASTLMTLSAVASLLCLLLHSFGLNVGGSLDGRLRAAIAHQLHRRRTARKEAAVRRLGAEEVAEALDDACPICLELLRPGDMVRLLPCPHRLHRHCVDPWLLISEACPLCKRHVPLPVPGGLL